MAQLSIIVPCYNHAKFLGERLRSIYAQVHDDFELIIFDDASTDGSVDVIQELLKEKHYTLIVNTVNSGSPFKQWETGISMAKGKYIWIAESDDSCDSSFASSLLESLEIESATLAFSRTKTIDEEGNTLKIPYWSEDVDKDFFEHHQSITCSEFLRKYMSARNCIPNVSSAIFATQDFKEMVLSVSRKVANYKYVGDWLFWAYLIKAYDSYHIIYNSNPLCFHRDHAASTRASMVRDKEKERIKEYSDATNQILLLQGMDAFLVFTKAIRFGWWDWSFYEYYWRYKPGKLEELLGTPQKGLHRLAYIIQLMSTKAINYRRTLSIVRSKLRALFT
jgi:glycosyltransferase involved in cell wall biosynthesis